jgi:Na+/H+-dicarboxylate symporter
VNNSTSSRTDAIAGHALEGVRSVAAVKTVLICGRPRPERAKSLHSVSEFLLNLIPTTVFDAFAKGDILQVLVFALRWPD